MANRVIENIAGVAVHSWVIGIIGIFVGVALQSEAVIASTYVCWPLFLLGWGYVLVDSLGLLSPHRDAKIGWTLGIIFLSGYFGPLYWWKVIRADHIWEDRASE